MRFRLSNGTFACTIIAVILTCSSAFAADTPPALVDAQAKFYNFLLSIAQGQGVTSTQRLVINNTIVPLDIASDTPYFNEELFRLNADRTFNSAVGSIQSSTAVFQAARFSSQYRTVINLAAAQIDQNHPEITNSLNELASQLSTATVALSNKNAEFEDAWAKVAEKRHLDPNSSDPKVADAYYAQRVTFFAQARYADQIETYSEAIDMINAQIEATRRKVYTVAEQAVLDNLTGLSKAYNIVRPWNAQTERANRAQGTPLSDLILADATRLPPALYDSSPLIMPVGDLTSFLSKSGIRSFDTSSYSSHLDAGSSSWNAGGSASFFGISLGGGGAGSSSFSHSVTKMNSLDMSFKNVAEYFVDRSAWFNPGVLQDPAIFKLVKGRPELNNLQYVSVSLILVRGLTLRLHFSEQVNTSDWSQSSFAAQGGVSFLGFSVGGGGGSSSSHTSISVDSSGTTVTFQDDDNIVRVIGARVEPFVAPQQPVFANQNLFFVHDPAVTKLFNDLQAGKKSYIDFQKEKIKAATAQQQP
jgi:tetratricopeptide (TPR) repeat protein